LGGLLNKKGNMKQTFVIIINSDDEIEIGQIGVPIMKALGLETIEVEKAAQQSVRHGFLTANSFLWRYRRTGALYHVEDVKA